MVKWTIMLQNNKRINCPGNSITIFPGFNKKSAIVPENRNRRSREIERERPSVRLWRVRRQRRDQVVYKLQKKPDVRGSDGIEFPENIIFRCQSA